MLSLVMTGVYVAVCLLLLVVVLLQQGKGGDIAAAFGGSGSQAAFSARSGATVLTRATTVLGTLFMLGALSLAIVGQRGPGSVLGGLPDETSPLEAAIESPAPLAEPTAAPADDTTPAPEQP